MRLWPGGGARAVERIDDACEADQRVLEHLAGLGSDPSSPRETRHYVYLPERADADAVAAALTATGWLVSIEASDRDWLVVASRICVLTSLGVRETRTELETLARDHRGVYDGWEATLR
jgi:hypothetical protein